MTRNALTLARNPFGQLVFTDDDGKTHQITPVRAFPIAAPTENIGLINADGEEIAWIGRLDELDPTTRTLLEEEMASREFMPVIQRILRVSSFACPSTWDIETDRGPTSMVLKGEEDIRRLASPALLITDSRGIHFLVRDRYALDGHSRRQLDRFL
ncbi:DUF1854 domain-containing protein [Zoogloea sp.]|uniref:cyanophycin metabolism-associated DUF1854 family protein n=1 Tax=Zoogloea sp. TaxID=49181 RepID=UPI00260F84B8|nr:DUF1854 domain-containing protein [Zoogloea sp.]MDD3355033.1 DUF1854 domain-containing protein [Zoogloea sp.]